MMQLRSGRALLLVRERHRFVPPTVCAIETNGNLTGRIKLRKQRHDLAFCNAHARWINPAVFGIGGHNNRAKPGHALTLNHSISANTHSVNSLHTELYRLASPVPLGHNEPMQTDSTHGHALLNHIIDNGGRVDLNQLRQWALTTHGKDAHYHTCSTEGLSLDGILQFFQERNKVSVNGTTVSVNVEMLCTHGDAPHTDHE